MGRLFDYLAKGRARGALAAVAAALAIIIAIIGVIGRWRRPAGRPPHPAPPRTEEEASERLGWLGSITHLSLRKRAIVFLAAVLVALLGVFAATQIKQELFPDIDLPAVTIVTRFPGASPDAIAAEVTEPIEGAISNLEGLERLQSTSAEGISLIVAEFEFGTDTEKREREIVSALDRLELPAGSERPVVHRIDMGDFPIVALTLYGEQSQAEIEALARDVIVPALQGIDGVFTVTVTGAQEPLLTVSLDPARMAKLGVTLADVTRTLTESALSSPSGFAIEEGRVLPVRTVQRLQSAEDIAHLPLVLASPAPAEGQTPAEPPRIEDVAQVGIAPSPLAAIARTNGQASVALGVFKTQEANTVSVANEVAATLDDLRARLPADVHTVVLFDQSDIIEESINALLREGLFGAIFAVLVILFFLTSVRATLVTAISIPLSMLAALAVLNWQGVTLNVMTLGGLTVAVGRVVDDSIVVLENIYVHSRRGQPLFRAAIAGTREVSTAILASTLTTVAVFLPLAFIGGLVQEAFLPFAQAVAFALLASFVVAMTVVPALSLVLIPTFRGHVGDTWLQRLYTPILRWCLGHRFLTLAGAGGMFLASFAILPFLDFSFLPGTDSDIIAGRIELPSGTSLSASNERAKEIEAALAEIDGLETYQLIVGLVDPTHPGAFHGGLPGANTIDLVLNFDEGTDMDREAAELRRLLGDFPDVEANIRILQPSFESDRVEIVVSGDDYAAVAATTGRLAKALASIPQLENIDSDVVESAPELLVQVDPERAATYGITAEQLSQQVRQLLVGLPLGTIQLGDRTMPMVLRLGQEGEIAAEEVGELALGGPGNPRLNQVAQLEVAAGPATVTRVDQRRAATITANIISSDVAGISDRVEAVVDGVKKEPGVAVRIGGIFEQQEEAFSDLYVAMGIGIFVVYVVMVASLGSLANPLIILFSLPFVSIGSFLALFITGRDLGLPALIGLLMLIGIVVTNAIVLITFVEMLRGRGLPTREAILEGGRSRVRPILMTALATIFALVPLSLGLGRGVIIAAELATVVIGGLFTSTLLTLVVIPILYSLFHDLRERLRLERTAQR